MAAALELRPVSNVPVPVGDAFTKLVVQIFQLQGCCPPLGTRWPDGPDQRALESAAAIEDAPLDGGADIVMIGV